jgi:hypothetical protein
VYVLGLVAGLTAAVPYVVTRHARPGEPASVSVLYRHPEGDIEYYPLVAAQARGSFTEFSVKEEEGTRLRWFPFPPLAVHATCYAAFGPYGFAVADALVSAAFYGLLFALLRTLRVSALLAAVVALLATSHQGITLTIGVGGHAFPLLAPVWGERIPRPFVSEVFVLAALLALIRIAVGGRMERPAMAWAALGVALALVIQSDVYSAFILLGGFGVLVLSRWWSRAEGTSWNAAIAIGTMGLFCVPFVIQRLLEHPDLPVRFGMFPVSRLRPLVDLKVLARSVFPLSVLAGNYALIGAFRNDIDRLHGDGWARSLRGVMVFFGALVALAFAAMPISTVVLGKAIQINHFPVRAAEFATYAHAVCLILGLDLVCRGIASQLTGPAAPRMAMAVILLTLLCLGVLYGRARTDTGSRYLRHLRTDTHGELDGLSREPYRDEFARLVRHLSQDVAGRGSVLATFDPQVYSWWLTFAEGHSFLAEPFISAVPDAIVEDRTIAFCRLIGMNSDEFISYIKQWNVNGWWLCSNKYQASKAHMFSTPDDYPPAELQAIRATTLYHTWHTVVPISEANRLRRKFELAAMADDHRWQLDVIVLTNDGPLPKFAPPAAKWRLTFESPRFRLYERRVSASVAQADTDGGP